MGKALAYVVSETYGDQSVIVFATSSAAARRRGADEVNSDWSSVECRRCSWADQYAPGPVPDLAKIDHGWWCECWGCGCRIDSDLEHYADNGRVRRLNPVEGSDGLYCTERCRSRSHAHKQARLKREKAALEKLRLALQRKLPGAVLLPGWDDKIGHAYAAWSPKARKYILKEASLAFTWPGSLHDSGRISLGSGTKSPTVTVAKGDLESFQAWRSATLARAAA